HWFASTALALVAPSPPARAPRRCPLCRPGSPPCTSMRLAMESARHRSASSGVLAKPDAWSSSQAAIQSSLSPSAWQGLSTTWYPRILSGLRQPICQAMDIARSPADDEPTEGRADIREPRRALDARQREQVYANAPGYGLAEQQRGQLRIREAVLHDSLHQLHDGLAEDGQQHDSRQILHGFSPYR